MSSHWFATSGEFGDSNGLVIVDTSKWTDELFDIVRQVSDWQVPQEAMRMSSLLEYFAPEVIVKWCLTHDLQALDDELHFQRGNVLSPLECDECGETHNIDEMMKDNNKEGN